MAILLLKRLFAVVGPSIFVAVVLAMPLGWLSRTMGWGFGPLAVFVGLGAGLVSAWRREGTAMGRIGSGLVGAVLGLIVFACTCTAARWNATAEVPDDRIDELCRRVVALRICGERQVMGVFDYQDVPDPIRREARDRVESMARAEKFDICDRTFGDRINDSAGGQAGIPVAVTAVLWFVLACCAAVAPAAIRGRSERLRSSF